MVQVRKAAVAAGDAENAGQGEAQGQAQEPAIDRAHLRQMTFSDTALEHEVLALFDRQAASMLELIPVATAEALPALVHAVKGSARGIGAWRVARAAAALEAAPQGNARVLMEALVEARAAIAEILPRD
jgi:HPt (histidine-containing phosphotransfer) domain-containing protein